MTKGRLESDGNGNVKSNERVFDVACSDGLTVDPKTHHCPVNGGRVDMASCAFSSDVGATELKARWHDPEFDARQRAFYYVRVLENSTSRWSTWDALRAGVAPRDDLPGTCSYNGGDISTAIGSVLGARFDVRFSIASISIYYKQLHE